MLDLKYSTLNNDALIPPNEWNIVYYGICILLYVFFIFCIPFKKRQVKDPLRNKSYCLASVKILNYLIPMLIGSITWRVMDVLNGEAIKKCNGKSPCDESLQY